MAIKALHTVLSGIFTDSFYGHSQAANEQPWHQNDETMTWNQAGVTVGAARVTEVGSRSYC